MLDMKVNTLLYLKFQRNLLNLWGMLTRSYIIYHYLANHKVKKLNIGCGTNILEGWLNSDLKPVSRSVIPLNACKRFPFSDASFDFVFAEHMIEHVTYTQGLFFLQECRRVLVSGGTLRLATPDLDFLIALFTAELSEIQVRYLRNFVSRYWSQSPYVFENPGFVANAFFQKWGHRFIYNHAILEHSLRQSGFSTLRRCLPGESTEVTLCNIEGHHRLISEDFNNLETMVIEAVV